MTTDERIDKIETRLSHMEKTMQQIKNICIGLAVGLLIAGIIFGAISVKEAISFVK